MGKKTYLSKQKRHLNYFTFKLKPNDVQKINCQLYNIKKQKTNFKKFYFKNVVNQINTLFN